MKRAILALVVVLVVGTCLGASHSYDWTHRMGASGADRVSGIATDGSGNVYLTGGFQSILNFAEDWGGMLPAYVFYLSLAAMWLGPSMALTHSMVGLRQRAVGSAVMFFFLNLIGLGLGPLTVGTLSDLMRPAYGDADGLRYAIVAVALTANSWAIIHYLLAARTVKSDIRH